MSGNLNQSKATVTVDAFGVQLCIAGAMNQRIGYANALDLHDALAAERPRIAATMATILRGELAEAQRRADELRAAIAGLEAALPGLADDTEIADALPADGEPEGTVGPTHSQPCPDCNGLGDRGGKTCPPCGGRGRVLSAADAKE